MNYSKYSITSAEIAEWLKDGESHALSELLPLARRRIPAEIAGRRYVRARKSYGVKGPLTCSPTKIVAIGRLLKIADTINYFSRSIVREWPEGINRLGHQSCMLAHLRVRLRDPAAGLGESDNRQRGRANREGTQRGVQKQLDQSEPVIP